jgi:hypothetical protein
MDAVANVVTTISDWWKSATDFFGLSGMKSSGLAGSLGALVPVFPITIGALLSLIAGATAALTAAYAFIRYINAKTDRFSQLVNAGVDPVEANRQATATAQAEAGYSFGARLERVMMFVTIAVAAVFLLPELMRK